MAASSADHYALLAGLFRDYVNSLGFPLTFQDFERELAEVESEYGPPGGRGWIVSVGDEPAGAVGLRRFDERTGEMKRMYVRPAFRGRGIGRALAEAVVAAAREIGYERVVLDTLGSMTAAQAIYRSLGFVEIPPYRHNPRPDAVFMALML